VYIPRVHGDAAAPPHPLEQSLQVGTETILVAEDEEALRTLFCEMLTALGYRVLSAGSAGETAQLIQNCREPIDLLLTDMVMPTMSGRELSELACSIHPGMRVLYVSGYDATQIRKPSDRSYREDFLPKPFTRQQLASSVRRLLDRKEP
jgi:two-component system cell cycle sensor histidine kinase/response regulator CckA